MNQLIKVEDSEEEDDEDYYESFVRTLSQQSERME